MQRACHQAPDNIITCLLSTCSVYAVYHLRPYYAIDEKPMLPYVHESGERGSQDLLEFARTQASLSFNLVVLLNRYKKATYTIGAG